MNLIFKKIILFTTCFLLILSLCSCEVNDGSPYPSGGRDLIAEFGIRRFVILEYHDKDNVKWDFRDREPNESIDRDIYNFEEEEPYVYTIGSKGYTKLNYETGEYTQNTDINSYNDDDKAIFNDLEKTKDKAKDRWLWF